MSTPADNTARISPLVACIGVLCAILVAAASASAHSMRTPLPPPRGAAHAFVTQPYHAMDAYKRMPWYHEETPGGAARSAPGALAGKVALVTGGSSGIGKAVASELYRLGATVVLTSRRESRAMRAAAAIEADVGTPPTAGALKPMALELNDLDKVRTFAKTFLARFDRLHYLVENAGAAPNMLAPPAAWSSPQGFEHFYASNYLGHYLLLRLLLPALRHAGPGARVTATSSIMHWNAARNLTSLLPVQGTAARGTIEGEGILGGIRQYANTKLLQVLMCFELQRRLHGEAAGAPNITATPVAPGFVSTAIASTVKGRDQWMPNGATPLQGAQTTLHALLSDDVRGKGGFFLQPYWSPLHRAPPDVLGTIGVVFVSEIVLQHRNWGLHRWLPHPNAHQRAFGKRLWEESAAVCGLDA